MTDSIRMLRLSQKLMVLYATLWLWKDTSFVKNGTSRLSADNLKFLSCCLVKTALAKEMLRRLRLLMYLATLNGAMFKANIRKHFQPCKRMWHLHIETILRINKVRYCTNFVFQTTSIQRSWKRYIPANASFLSELRIFEVTGIK